METAIYCRVSTEEQAQEGFSIRAQEQKLKDYARIKDWSIYNIYIDEGISGKNITDRPAAKQMLLDVESGKVENVLVFKIDRLTRNTADLIYFVDLFNEHDCSFNSLMESIDTRTPSGRMFLKIIGIFAEFERENIIERVKLGRERKVKEGYTLCSSHASYGYDRANGQKIQSINEEEAEIVREIFDMFVNQNMPLNSIAKALNIRKIPTKKNAGWQRKNIKNILQNSNYIGKVRHFIDDQEKYSENDGLHEAIISEEIFNQAKQLIVREPNKNPTKKPKEENYFLGSLVCECCGKKLVSHNRYIQLKGGTKKFRGAYRCGNTFVGSCDSGGDMSHDKVEAAFKAYISHIGDFSVADSIRLEEQEKASIDRQKSADEYNNKIAELSAKEKEILNRYVDNEIDFESYKSMKQKISRDTDFIKAELEKLKVFDQSDSPIKKEDIILNIQENWDLLTNIEKRQFLTRFINRIVIKSERSKNTRLNTVKIESIEFHTVNESVPVISKESVRRTLKSR